jgi:hypothetical protein
MDDQGNTPRPPAPLSRGDPNLRSEDPLLRGVPDGRGVSIDLPVPYLNFITCEPAARKAPAPYS